LFKIIILFYYSYILSVCLGIPSVLCLVGSSVTSYGSPNDGKVFKESDSVISYRRTLLKRIQNLIPILTVVLYSRNRIALVSILNYY